MAAGTPVVDGYFDEDGLIGGACGACGRRHFPRGAHCPWCGAAAPDEVRLSPEGRLWSWTSVGTAPPGYVGPVPFGFGVVELPVDGLAVVTLLTEADPTRLREGHAMAFTVVEVGEGATSWAFRPAPEEAGSS